jgi:small subunit ribosomal protein S17
MNKNCEDINCPIHGKISVRGKLIEGTVIRKKTGKTAYIQVEEKKYIPKYERYITKIHKKAVHCPECLDISVGDIVLCGETRKISKTKSFVVLKKQAKDKKVKVVKDETN